MTRALQIHHPDGSTSTFPLDKPVVKIGRTADNDIILVDEERSVSRWHAVVHVEPDQVRVADLNSSNGTHVNGKPISTETVLKPDDAIKVGLYKLVYSEAGTPADQLSTQRLPAEVPPPVPAADLVPPAPPPPPPPPPAPPLPKYAIEAELADLTELQREPALAGLPDDPAGNPGLQYEIGAVLARRNSAEEVTETALELLFRISQVHRAGLLKWDVDLQSFGELDLRGHSGKVTDLPEPYDPRGLVLNGETLARLRVENHALLVRDSKSRAMAEGFESIVRTGIQVALCAPLNFGGKFFGVLYADNLAEPTAFSSADSLSFASIAAQTGIALANTASRPGVPSPSPAPVQAAPTAVEPPAPPAPPQFSQIDVERKALSRCLPPQIAGMAVSPAGLDQLQGVLQPVAVLYAEIRGLTISLDPAEAHVVVQALNEIFTALGAAAVQSNGMIDRFAGNYLVALFGAPAASSQAPRDGLKAAIAMEREMGRLNGARIRRQQSPLQIAIGLHCGPAIVGNIGSADRIQYSAIGDTVDVAAKLVHKASPWEVIVSSDLRAAIPDYGGFQPSGDLELEGRSYRMTLFAAQWADVPLE